MYNEDIFWKASVDDLKKGYIKNKDKKKKLFICLICGKNFEKGVIYASGENLLNAKKAIKSHINLDHKPMFQYFLDMGKVYTSLTQHQKELMHMFYNGLTDKEIAKKANATNTSTIRNQRFTLREKYKQAKIITATMELLEERRESHKMSNITTDKSTQDESLADFHRTATMIDERYSITKLEKEEVLQRYFDNNNNLLIKNFPAKEKKKIIILQRIIERFEQNKNYTEKEVNSIISNFYDDIPTIRRYFIEYGFLERTKNGDKYWVKQ